MEQVISRATLEPARPPDRQGALVIALTTLLCESGDFDKLREDQPELASDLDKIDAGSILGHVVTMLVKLATIPSEPWQALALQNMGMLLRTHAALWTRDDVTALLSDIFASKHPRHKETVVRALSDYLSREHERKAAEVEALSNKTPGSSRKKVDMDQLVGNTEAFADSSVSTQLIQLYLQPVIDGALNADMPVTQRLSLEILSHTVLRGLSHPLQCLPALIALETSADPRISAKALHMHSHLASKHGSILAVRYLAHARAAFSFQGKMKEDENAPIRGFRNIEEPRALLQSWYNLIRDRRQPRLDFLKALCKAMDVDSNSSPTRDTVSFAVFLADTLATLEYKGQEEVLTVIFELKKILSVAGSQVLFIAQQTAEILEDDVDLQETVSVASSRATRSGRGTASIGSFDDAPARTTTRLTRHQQRLEAASDASENSSDATRAAQILTIVLMLRTHLKWLYSFSEA